ncbi:DSBA-like thioredoxin domain protein [compost metagenome]
MDQEEARTILNSDAYADEVNADKKEAIAKGIQSVPTVIVNNQFVIQGVQPVEMVVQAFKKAATR